MGLFNFWKTPSSFSSNHMVSTEKIMPVDISHLTVKANLKSKKSGKGNVKDSHKMAKNMQVNMMKTVLQMFMDFVPMVRDDMHDRLNR